MAVTKKKKTTVRKPAAKVSPKNKKMKKTAAKPVGKQGKTSGNKANKSPSVHRSQKNAQKQKSIQYQKKTLAKKEESLAVGTVGMDDVPISAVEMDRDLMSEVMSVDDVPVEGAMDGDAVEAEARSLDLDEVATEADALEDEDHEPADASDMPDAADIGDAIDEYAPLPMSDYGDDFDGADVMSGFAGRSILGAEERNAVIQEVKQRAEKNGGYVTYDELNQIVPMTVQDEATADEYLQILTQLNVDVIRAEDVDTYRANKDKLGDSRLHGIRVQEMFDDPIRMYLHQMGQVPLLSQSG